MQLPAPLKAAMSILIYAACASALVASHGFDQYVQFIFAAVAGTAIAVLSKRKGYVSTSGMRRLDRPIALQKLLVMHFCMHAFSFASMPA